MWVHKKWIAASLIVFGGFVRFRQEKWQTKWTIKSCPNPLLFSSPYTTLLKHYAYLLGVVHQTQICPISNSEHCLKNKRVINNKINLCVESGHILVLTRLELLWGFYLEPFSSTGAYKNCIEVRKRGQCSAFNSIYRVRISSIFHIHIMFSISNQIKQFSLSRKKAYSVLRLRHTSIIPSTISVTHISQSLNG